MGKIPTTYFIAGDSEAYGMLEEVLNGFPRFKHIQLSDIILFYKVAPNNRFVAETRKMSKLYSVLAPGKEIVITLYRPKWESMNRPTKIAVFYHELCHVGMDEEKEEYHLIRHDVEDFQELVVKLGFNYEKALDLMKEMNVQSSIKTTVPLLL